MGAPRRGWITATVGTAISRVCCLRRLEAWTREEIPVTIWYAMAAARPQSTTAMPIQDTTDRRGGDGAPGTAAGGLRMRGKLRRPGPAAAMQQGKHSGNKDQGRDRGEQQAADHRAAQRRVLFAALAHSQRHGHHADDHGERRHDHRAETREAGGQRGFHRVAAAMHMMAPIMAGTLSVVCVTKSIRTMPASAAGKAVMMMNGSSQD